jgi:Holliday junction resolvase RusA-like endonuclease
VERPKAHYGSGRNADKLKDSAPAFPLGKPDVDKLSRGVMDALTGIIFRDDSCVVTKRASKRYGRPGVAIEVCEAVT